MTSSYCSLVFTITILLSAILPIGFAQIISYSNFNYTEISYQDNLTGTPPHVLGIKHYADSGGAAVVRIGRLEFGPSYLIKGTTIWKPNEFIVNNITPKNGFLRLSAANGTGDFEWSQYAYNGNGSFKLMTKNRTHDNAIFTSFQVTVFATLDGGYAIVYANSTNMASTNTTTSSDATEFTTTAGLYALILGYNQTTTPKRIILYELSKPNITFTYLYCSVDFVSIGHSCVTAVSHVHTAVNQTNTTIITTATQTVPVTVAPATTASQTIVTVVPVITTVPQSVATTIFIVKIRFLSSGSLLSIDPIFPPNSNITNVNVRTLPLGGYAILLRQFSVLALNLNFSLYDEENKPTNYNFPLKPIVTDLLGAFDITQNNTMLIAQNETSNSAWKLLSITMPKLTPYNDDGYGNLHIIATQPQNKINNLTLNHNSINITFRESITFSNGFLNIYQITSEGSFLRQKINSRTCDQSTQCNISDNSVILDVLECTFNEPEGKYCIQMDNNFVMSSQYGEPMLGIDPNMWTFQTVVDNDPNSKHDSNIQGSLRLTANGTQHFQNLDSSKQSEFIDTLIKELTTMIPTENKRLDSNQNVQFDKSKLLISFLINDNYGVQITHSLAESIAENKTKFITLFVVIVAFLLVFLFFRAKAKEGENLIILQFGVTMFRFISYVIFVIFDSTAISFLYTPSLVILAIPTAFNLIFAFTILFSEREQSFRYWFGQHTRIAVTSALISGANIDMLFLIKSYLMKWEFFNAPLSRNSLKGIFWGGCINIFISDIPQFIIQVVYLRYSVIFDPIPIITLIASGLSTVSNIITKLFIRFRVFDEYLKGHLERKKGIKNDSTENENEANGLGISDKDKTDGETKFE
ncbi:19707_t:CDS:10 [Gigaspora margarita]|uniref:19707_t:CDS:1 n=1 Tax=Gigaspora margarita TaxID=4874 RepID=A0ABM8W573_GIGMA|nr:19707_t:CDS:10 [Gigaspora margarita]